MSSDKENVKMKGSKPPPPVPPRPSKTLIKEALAKTKQAYGTYITSVPRSQNDEKPPTRQAPLVPETNDRLILSGNVSFNNICEQTSNVNNACERHTQFNNYSTRPVIYQSENCKKRLFDMEVTKKSDTDINRTNNKNSIRLINEVRISESESENNNYIRKLSSSEPLLPSGLKIKHISGIKKELNNAECGRNNNIGNLKNTDADFGKRNNDSEFGITITPDDELSSLISKESASPDCNKNDNTFDQNWDDELNNRNHVNTLIDEMFASVLEVNLSSSTSASSSAENIIKESEYKCNISNDNLACNNSISDDDNLTIIIINENPPNKSIPEPNKTEITMLAPERERKVTFNDLHNHEYLINELQNMKNQEDNILKRQRLSSLNREDDNITFQDGDKIQMNDWYGVNEGKKVRMSSCHIQIDDSCVGSIGQQKIKNMSRVYGLPPLPKSLCGFKFTEVTRNPERSDSIRSNGSSQMGYFGSEEISTTEDSPKEKISLDRQLAILRREMDSLREQDISLLSKLWFLNESIQDFRQMLQEQEEKLNLTLSASPTPSSVEDEEFYVITTSTC